MGNPGDKYTIQILNGIKGSSSQKATAKATSQTGDGKSQALLVGAIVAKELRSIGNQTVSYAVSTVGLTTGNSVSQQRIQSALNYGSKLVSYGVALGTQNYAAAAMMAVQDTMNIVFGVNAYNLKNSVELESLALSRERAGVAFNQSRLGAAK